MTRRQATGPLRVAGALWVPAIRTRIPGSNPTAGSGTLKRFADEILRPKVDPFEALHAAVKYAVMAVNGLGGPRLAEAGPAPAAWVHPPAGPDARWSPIRPAR